MRSIILLALALLSMSQVIVAENGGQTVQALVAETVQAVVPEKTEPVLPLVAEKTQPPEPLVAAKTQPVQQAEPLEQGKITVAEPVIHEPVPVGGKVTAQPLVEEPVVIAGKLTAERLVATQPGIEVIVPSAPERGVLLTPTTPQVVVDGERREPQIDVITPQRQPRQPITGDRHIGGRGDIVPPNRTPKTWVIRAVNDSWVPAYLLVMPGDQVTWVWGEGPMMAQQQQQQQQQYVPIPEQLQHQEEPLKVTAQPVIQEPAQEYIPIPSKESQKQVLDEANRGVGRITSIGGRASDIIGGAGARVTNIPSATDVGTFGAFRDNTLHNVVSVREATSLEHNSGGFYSGPPSRHGSYTHIFTASGTHWYMCEVHPNEQRGVVVVSDVPETASGVLSQPLFPLLVSAILAVFGFNRYI